MREYAWGERNVKYGIRNSECGMRNKDVSEYSLNLAYAATPKLPTWKMRSVFSTFDATNFNGAVGYYEMRLLHPRGSGTIASE
jgi:hypothetical protein